MNQTETLITKFKHRMQAAVDYYEAWLWADQDRHRLIALEWIATKRALKAERENYKLRQELKKLREELTDNKPPDGLDIWGR